MNWNTPIAINQSFTEILNTPATNSGTELHRIAREEPALFRKILRNAKNEELLRRVLLVPDAQGNTAYLAFCQNNTAQITPLPLQEKRWIAELILAANHNGQTPLHAVWGRKCLTQVATAPFSEEQVYARLQSIYDKELDHHTQDDPWFAEISAHALIAKLEKYGWSALTDSDHHNWRNCTLAGHSAIELLLRQRKLHLIPDDAPWERLFAIRNRAGDSLLHVAANLPKQEQLAGLPVSKLTDVHLKQQNKVGLNVLHVAALAGNIHHFESVPGFEDVLLRTQDNYRNTPFHSAIRTNSYQALPPRYLLEKCPSAKWMLIHENIPEPRRVLTYLHTILLYKQNRDAISYEQLYPIYNELKTAAEDLGCFIDNNPGHLQCTEVTPTAIRDVCVNASKYYVRRQLEERKKAAETRTATKS